MPKRKNKVRTNKAPSKKPKKLQRRKNARGPKKKATSKSRNVISGLNRNKFSRIKQEFHDIDYADKLTQEEKIWLATFMEEDLGARMKHPGKKIYKKKKDKLEAYRRNNKRNWDIYSIARATGMFDNEELNNTMLDSRQNLETTHPEDAIVELIDEMRKNAKLTEEE